MSSTNTLGAITSRLYPAAQPDGVVFCITTIFILTPTAPRHQIMVSVNEMDEWIVGADATR